MSARPVGCNVPLDTDSVNPDSIIAAVTYGIRNVEDTAEKNGLALDWNSLAMAMAVDPDDEDTTHLQVRVKRLVR